MNRIEIFLIRIFCRVSPRGGAHVTATFRRDPTALRTVVLLRRTARIITCRLDPIMDRNGGLFVSWPGISWKYPG